MDWAQYPNPRKDCYNPATNSIDVITKKVIAVELSREEVRRIAELAKLSLSDEEVDLYAGQLSSILGYFRKLQEIDTSHIAPTASVLPLNNVFRQDIPEPALPPEQVIANAVSARDNQFLVSNILEND